MLKLGEAKKIVGNLLKVKDVKLAKGFTIKTAAEKIMPVAASSLILKQLRELPVFGQILTGLDRLYDFASDLVAKVPIIGWASEWVTENINKPLATMLGGYAPKSESSENDKTWYTETKKDLQITDTTGRPIGLSYTSDVTQSTVTGAVARMLHMNVNIFRMDKMTAFTHTMTNLWENMTNGYRRSVTYTQNQVEAYIINSVSYYILAKYFEKKIGYMKFDDPSYPDFRADWSLTYNQRSSVGVVPATTNPMLSLDEEEHSNSFTHTKEVYEVISSWKRNFLLPKNLKKWVDHYFTSVFILDDDTANTKYIDVNPVTLYFAQYNSSNNTYSVVERALTSFSIDDLMNELTSFFKANATIRADLNNGAVYANSYDSKTPLLNLMDTGWITPYEQFVPKPVISDTFKQAIINAYTTDTDFSALFKNNFVRFDYLNDNRCGDEFTALLFAGAAVPSDNIWLKDGHLSCENIAIVLNGGEQGVDIPASWLGAIETDSSLDQITHLTTPHIAIFKTEAGEEDTIYSATTSASEDEENAHMYFLWDETFTNEGNVYDIASDTVTFSTNSYGRLWFGNATMFFRDENGILLQNLSSSDVIDFLTEINKLSYCYLYVAYARTSTDVYYHCLMLTKRTGGSWLNQSDISITVLNDIDRIDIADHPNLPPYFIGFNQPITIRGTEYYPYNNLVGTNFGDFNNINVSSLDNDVSEADGTITASPYNEDTTIYFELGSNGVSLIPVLNVYNNKSWNCVVIDGLSEFTIQEFTPLSPWTFAQSDVKIITGESTEIRVSATVFRRLVGYSAWCHMAMGYSIPVSDTSKLIVRITHNEETIKTITNESTSLLKEDYVPMFISRNDLPWILYWMYQSLFYIELLPYKEK